MKGLYRRLQSPQLRASQLLTQPIVVLHRLDGPRTIIPVYPSPGFQSVANNDSLDPLKVTIEVSRVKNKNKTSVAEKAVRELEDEIIR